MKFKWGAPLAVQHSLGGTSAFGSMRYVMTSHCVYRGVLIASQTTKRCIGFKSTHNIWGVN